MQKSITLIIVFVSIVSFSRAQSPGDIQTIIQYNDCCNNKEESSDGLNNSFGNNIGVKLSALGAGNPFNSSVGCSWGQEYIANNWSPGDRWQTGQFHTRFHGGITAEWIQMNFTGGPGGPKQFQVSLDNSTWIDVGSNYSLQVVSNCQANKVYNGNELLPAIVDNQPVVYLRWLNISGTSGTGQGSRIADILVQGELCKGIDCAVSITGVTTTIPSCPEKTDGSIIINGSSCAGPDCDGDLEYSIDAGATFQSSNIFNVGPGSYDVFVRTKDNPCCTKLYDSNPIVLGFSDTESPSIENCPGNVMQGTDINNCSASVTWTHPTASDNCADPTLKVSYTAGIPAPTSLPSGGNVTSGGTANKTFAIGKTIVTYTVTDAGNNQVSTCSFEVTIADDDPPVINCPSEIVMSNDPGQCEATVTFTPTAVDNCPGGVNIVTEPVSGSTFPVGLSVVTVTATDITGNIAECTFDVMINDTEAPSISCPSDIEVDNDAGQCGAVVNFSPIGTDNCPGVVVTADPTSGSLFPIGLTVVTVTAIDGAGNMSQCNFNVTVNDAEDLTISCPSDIMAVNDAGTCSAIVSFTPTGADNCLDVNVSALPTSGSAFPIGVTVVTATATDTEGNSVQCSFNITVSDTEDPTISCPTDMVLNNDVGQCGAMVDFTISATDNCPGVSVSSVPATGSLFPVGITNVTATATDLAGNTKECNFNVMVNDNEDPVITCPDGTATSFTLYVDANCEGVLPDYTHDASATDNCALAPNITQSPSTGTILNGHGTTQQVTLTANDSYGNTAECTFIVTLQDTIDPVISCPDGTATSFTLFVDTNCGVPLPDYMIDATATDNCTILPVITQSPAPGTRLNGDGTTQLVTLTADDDHGNTSECTFTVTLQDTIDPVISCPDGTATSFTLYVDSNCGVPLPDYTTDATATDNCTILPVITQSPAPGALLNGHGSTQLVTLTADDNHGNIVECTFTIILEDSAPTILNCSPDQTQLLPCGANELSVTLPIPSFAPRCQLPVLEFRYRTVNPSNVPTGAFTTYYSSSGNTKNFGKGRYEIQWRATVDAGESFCSYYLQMSETTPTIPMILGSSTICPNLTNIPYSVSSQPGITDYQWSYSGDGVTIHNNGNPEVTLDFSTVATAGTLAVQIINPCGGASSSSNINIEMGGANCTFVNCLVADLFVNNVTLVLPGIPQVFKVSDQIKSNANIGSAKTILFKAGDSVDLLDGFSVEKGAVFVAEIEGCPIVFPPGANK